MTVQSIGKFILTVDNEIEARLIPFNDALAGDAGYEPEMGYFGHPRMKTAARIDDLRSAVSPETVRFPATPPASLRLLGFHYLHTVSGKLSDMAATFVESELRVQRLAFGTRPLVPSDYAVACFWTRRIGTPIVYTAQRAERLNLDAGCCSARTQRHASGPGPPYA